MSEATYYQRNRDVMLNRANEYYENNKEYQEKKQKIHIENYLRKKKI